MDLPGKVPALQERHFPVMRHIDAPVLRRQAAQQAPVTLRDRDVTAPPPPVSGEGTPPAAPGFPHIADVHVRRHEWRNAVHTLQGLIQIARSAGARPTSPTAATAVPFTEVGEIVQRVGNPLVCAQLVGKLLVASERGVELRLGSDSFLPCGIDSADELVAVIGNLIDNAFDAVARTVRSTPTVEVGLRHEQGVVELSVSDNGPGIDPRQRQWIFLRGASTKRSSPVRPRGIGLSLVQAIAEERGGSITVGDREGGGAVFTVRMAAVVGR